MDINLLATWIGSGLGVTCGIATAGFAYASVVETTTILTEVVDVRLPRLGREFDGFRIAQISDLHFRPYTGEREIAAAVKAVNDARPDAIVLTGDYVTSSWLFHLGKRTADGIEDCAVILRGLTAPCGVYAVLGNHDWGTDPDRIAEALRWAGMKVLRNDALALERNGSRLWIAGIDSAYFDHADIDRTLAKVPAGEPVLLLAHEPDFADVAARYPVDLQLSGHSHGGQIVPPLMSPPYLPKLGRKYPRGRYQVRDLQLYTNRGIGVDGAPLRYNAPPEVTVVRFNAG